MSMEKEFVPYQEALELKKLGFDEPCFGAYRTQGDKSLFYAREGDLIIEVNADMYASTIKAPTFSQAFRFFREKYNICGWVQESYFRGLKFHQYHISGVETLNIISDLSDCSYEEVELACLRKLIENRKMIQEEIEQYAWENPIFSRKDVYELFNDVFKDKKIEGAYQLSASKQVYEFNSRLRELAKQKVMVKK